MRLHHKIIPVTFVLMLALLGIYQYETYQSATSRGLKYRDSETHYAHTHSAAIPTLRHVNDANVTESPNQHALLERTPMPINENKNVEEHKANSLDNSFQNTTIAKNVLEGNATSQSSARKFAFLHIPKTAGSTLKAILNRYALVNGMDSLPYPTFAELQAATYEYTDLVTWDIITGHYRVSLKKILGNKYTYLTIVRDPVDILVSIYYYFHRKAAPTFEDYILKLSNGSLETTTNKVLFDPQCQWFQISLKSEDKIQAQVDSMMSQFDWIGVTDMFSESLLLLRDVYGIKDIDYRKMNVVKERPEKMVISPKVMDIIKSNTLCDTYFYEKARELLQKRLNDTYGGHLNDTIEEFRRNQGSAACGRFERHGKCAYTIDTMKALQMKQKGITVKQSMSQKMMFLGPDMLRNNPIRSFVRFYSRDSKRVVIANKDKSIQNLLLTENMVYSWDLLIGEKPMKPADQKSLLYYPKYFVYIMHPIETVFRLYSLKREKKSQTFRDFVKKNNLKKKPFKDGNTVLRANIYCEILLGRSTFPKSNQTVIRTLESLDWIGVWKEPKASLSLLAHLALGNHSHPFPYVKKQLDDFAKDFKRIPKSVRTSIAKDWQCDFQLFTLASQIVLDRYKELVLSVGK